MSKTSTETLSNKMKTAASASVINTAFERRLYTLKVRLKYFQILKLGITFTIFQYMFNIIA